MTKYSNTQFRSNFRQSELTNFRQGPLGSFIVLIIAMLCLVPQFATAHKNAASSFTAKTDENKIDFDFRLDATSAVDVVKRAYPELTELKKSELKPHKKLLLDYIEHHVLVENNETPCKHLPSTYFQYAEAIDKLVVRRPIQCRGELDRLTIDAFLFFEEETVHTTLGTFHHIRAKEQYVFAQRKLAIINVKSLRQAPKRTFSKNYRGVPSGMPGNIQQDQLKDGRPKVETAEKLGSGFVVFLKQGIFHILSGLDHVLFVLALLIAAYRWKQLALVITSFTIAHSITLVLGALNLIKISPALVEPIIALSIIYVAIENIVRKEPKARHAVTFGFGLMHGLGFSAVLQNIGLPSSDLALSLLGFNVGVEIGQLMIIVPLFPLLIWIHKKEGNLHKKVKWVLCIGVSLVAAYWFVLRVMDAVNG